MFIEDLVVLGTAVPERTSDGRRTVCLAGHSASMGFIRIYPCRPDIHVSRWDILRIEVERNKVDTRHESWQVINSTPEWETLNQHIETVGKVKSVEERRAMLDRNVSACVSEVNERHDSLGIVLTSKVHRAYFDKNPQYNRPYQPHLIERPGEWVRPKASFPIEPRLAYSCTGCKGKHDQKILEWGAFEWMRKFPAKTEQYWDNLGLYKPDYDLYLLVGNQILQRTSFLVINIIPIKRTVADLNGARYAKQLDLFA